MTDSVSLPDIPQPTPVEEQDAVPEPPPADRVLWDLAHRFDQSAIDTGRCAIGSFENGCAHRLPNVRDTLRAVRG